MGEELGEHSREVAKGSFWGLAGTVLFKLISFAYWVVIARAASQEDVGLFSLVLGLISVITVFSDLGVPAALVRFVPFFQGKGEEGKSRHLLRLSYGALAISGLAAAVLLWWQADAVGALFGNARMPEAVRFFAIHVLIYNLFRMHTSYLQGIADIRASQAVQNSQNLMKLVLTVALFWAYGPSVAAMIAGFILSHVAGIALSMPRIVGAMRRSPGEAFISRAELLRDVVPMGAMLAAVQYLVTIIASSDRLLLGYLTDPASAETTVAVYSMAITLATVLSLFPMSIGGIFLPVVSRLAGKGDTREMRSTMETAQRWSLFVTLPIALVMVAFSSQMLGLFYGASYVAGAFAMSIFAIGMALNYASYMVSLALAAQRLVRIELIVAAIACAANIALNVALIPMFGMEGAAAASALSFALSGILLWHYGKKLLGYHFPPEVLRLLAAAAIACVLLLLSKPLVSELAAMLPAAGEGDAAAYLSKGIYLAFIGTLLCLSGALFAAFALLLKCFRGEDVALMGKVLRRAMVPEPLIALVERVASHGVSARE